MYVQVKEEPEDGAGAKKRKRKSRWEDTEEVKTVGEVLPKWPKQLTLPGGIVVRCRCP